MAQANLDELRFFLDGREDIAPHVQAIGATVTDLMVAISAEEYARMAPTERAQEVTVLLEHAAVQELSAADIELLE